MKNSETYYFETKYRDFIRTYLLQRDHPKKKSKQFHQLSRKIEELGRIVPKI